MTPSKNFEPLSADDAEPPGQRLIILLANQTETVVDEQRLESAVRLALSESPFCEGEISVAIVDDPTIHRLNRQFLEHDYPTDVLSFALEDDPPRIAGEIIVSVDTAARCAEEHRWPAEDELLLYVAHGALHLAGYRDKSPQDETAMKLAEAEVLAQLGVIRSVYDSRWQADAAQEEPTT